jgi:hypothetical protein
VGEFAHACEGDMVCTSTNEKVPYFNAPIYLENKTQIGKIDEIFGPTTAMVRARRRAPWPPPAAARAPVTPPPRAPLGRCSRSSAAMAS